MGASAAPETDRTRRMAQEKQRSDNACRKAQQPMSMA
jgi:hypothetical protein